MNFEFSITTKSGDVYNFSMEDKRLTVNDTDFEPEASPELYALAYAYQAKLDEDGESGQ